MGKKMKGLMCHSPASIAVVCMSNDHRRSAITPRALAGQARPINYSSKYIRLGEHRAIPTPSRRISFLDQIDDQEKNKNKPQGAVTTTSIPLSNLAFQVVVMRVSLHCQACAGKVKRHLSRMDGVTWFSIELESKRVTVMGHVSPSAVVDSISTVKKAELWHAAAARS